MKTPEIKTTIEDDIDISLRPNKPQKIPFLPGRTIIIVSENTFIGILTMKENGEILFEYELQPPKKSKVLEAGFYKLGRAPHADLVINKVGISKNHLTIEVKTDKSLMINDCISSRGTELTVSTPIQQKPETVEKIPSPWWKNLSTPTKAAIAACLAGTITSSAIAVGIAERDATEIGQLQDQNAQLKAAIERAQNCDGGVNPKKK